MAHKRPRQRRSQQQNDRKVNRRRESVVERLGRAVRALDIKVVARLLKNWDRLIAATTPRSPEALPLLDYTARWIDFDSRYLPMVEKALKQFYVQLGTKRQSLPFINAAHLDTVEGLVDHHHERYQSAIHHFENVMRFADWVPDNDLRVISRFYLSRCYWKTAKYPTAIEYARDAHAIEKKTGHRHRLAIIEIIEGWFQFVEGNLDEAKTIFNEAQAHLKGMDDFVNEGNIQSFYGRLLRAEGEYHNSREYFEKSIETYRRADPDFRNIARSHANIALVYELSIRNLIDRPAAKQPSDTKRLNQDIEELSQKAFDHLDAAEKICASQPRVNHRLLGTIRNIRALLFYDQSKFGFAQAEIYEAYKLGSKTNDHLIMANAKVIESMIVLAWRDDAAAAYGFAQTATDHASQTDNWRSQVRSFIQQGRSLLALNDPSAARDCWNKANDVFKRGHSDYLREEFEKLNNDIISFIGAEAVFVITPSEIDGAIQARITRGSKVKPVKLLEKKVAEEITWFVYKRNRNAANKTRGAQSKTATDLGINHTRVREIVKARSKAEKN